MNTTRWHRTNDTRSPVYGQLNEETNAWFAEARAKREVATQLVQSNCTHVWTYVHCCKEDRDDYHCEDCGMDLINFYGALPQVGFGENS